MSKPLPPTRGETIRLTDEMWVAISRYQHKHLISTKSEAIRELISAGLAVPRVARVGSDA
jgi:hypothetical protein